MPTFFKIILDDFSRTFLLGRYFEILSVGQLRENQFLTLAHQCLNAQAYFLDIFSTNSVHHSYHATNPDKLVYEKKITVKLAHSPCVSSHNCSPLECSLGQH